MPALGGQTPGEAVGNEAGRQQVARLLDDFENEQQRPPEPQHAFDYDKLRRELGLETYMGPGWRRCIYVVMTIRSVPKSSKLENRADLGSSSLTIYTRPLCPSRGPTRRRRLY